MKRILKIFLVILIILNLNFSFVNAEKIKEEISISQKTIEKKLGNNLTIGEIFIYFSEFFKEDTPESYKYISLKYYGYPKNSEIENALKILVYNNKIPNEQTNLKFSLFKSIDNLSFYKLAEKILKVGYSEKTIKSYGIKKVDFFDLELVEESYKVIKNKEFFEKNIQKNNLNKDILENVYDLITNEHFEKEKIDKKNLYYSAIKGLTNAVGDKHTVFFPPIESKSFIDSLSGDFVGIGTYVEMPKPGVFKITAPIIGGPAEKIGIKGGDIVIEVDGKKVTEKNSQEEVISWIKGEEGTEVKLKIKRGEQIIDFKIIREKVHIKSIETNVNGSSFIIKIIGFNEGIADEFREAIEEINSKKNINKIIIDLRDNGGGLLEEVVYMLSYIVPKGNPVANVKNLYNDGTYLSKGLNLLNLNNYKIVFIQNNGTASASEIMIGTIKDYFPNVKIVGEKSYGKGSVQTIKEFSDGSSLKYTTAKWFTGKTKTGIDGNGITPDVEIKFDEEKFKKYKIDNQLEKALTL